MYTICLFLKVDLGFFLISLMSRTACYCIEPGWFRSCLTALAVEDIPVDHGMDQSSC